MSIPSHRHNAPANIDDEELSEGELDSSISDDDDPPTISQPQQISQSWTKMLTDQNLSSIMTNALADDSQIIHIDDPITQQSDNPLTYKFPPGTNVKNYFERKKKQIEANSPRPPSRRDVKNLSRLLSKEKNEDLLRAILEIVGCRRAFQIAHKAIELYNTDEVTIKTSDNGQKRTLGGFYFKMFIKDNDNNLITEQERNQIRKRNQEIQKVKKKKKSKKSKSNAMDDK